MKIKDELGDETIANQGQNPMTGYAWEVYECGCAVSYDEIGTLLIAQNCAKGHRSFTESNEET